MRPTTCDVPRLDELAARSLRVAEYEYEQIAYFSQAFTDQAGGTGTAAWPTITG
jgi:hypothetical protein